MLFGHYKPKNESKGQINSYKIELEIELKIGFKIGIKTELEIELENLRLIRQIRLISGNIFFRQ